MWTQGHTRAPQISPLTHHGSGSSSILGGPKSPTSQAVVQIQYVSPDTAPRGARYVLTSDVGESRIQSVATSQGRGRSMEVGQSREKGSCQHSASGSGERYS